MADTSIVSSTVDEI